MDLSLDLMRESIAAGDAQSAFDIYETLPGDLSESDLRALLEVQFQAQAWPRFRLLAKEFIGRFNDASSPVRLKLAEILIRRQKQPEKGLRALATVQRHKLSPEELALHDTLTQEAQRLQEAGALEFADDFDDDE